MTADFIRWMTDFRRQRVLKLEVGPVVVPKITGLCRGKDAEVGIYQLGIETVLPSSMRGTKTPASRPSSLTAFQPSTYYLTPYLLSLTASALSFQL